MFDLSVNHRSDVMTAALEASAMVFGSPTRSHLEMVTIADLVLHERGFRPANKVWLPVLPVWLVW